MRSLLTVSAYLFLIAVGAAAAYRSRIVQPASALTGNEEVTALCLPADEHWRRSPLDDPIGQVYVAGTTWYDVQHNGTAGKMIAVDSEGWVHLSWM